VLLEIGLFVLGANDQRDRIGSFRVVNFYRRFQQTRDPQVVNKKQKGKKDQQVKPDHLPEVNLFAVLGFSAAVKLVRGLTTETTGLTRLIQKGTLRRAGSCEFAVLLTPNLNGDPGECQ
jgi:hypothetical protein